MPAEGSLIEFSKGNDSPFDVVKIHEGSSPVGGDVDKLQVDFNSSQDLSAPTGGAKVIAVAPPPKVKNKPKPKEVATTDLMITLDSKTKGFDKLVFDAHLTSGKGGYGTPGDVFLTINGVDKSGNPFELDHVKDPAGYSIGKGENFLTIVATNGSIMTSVEIFAPYGWTETSHIEMYGLSKIPHHKFNAPLHAPEPSTMAIALLGLIGFAGAGLYRLRIG
jgi:hypothetical protein